MSGARSVGLCVCGDEIFEGDRPHAHPELVAHRPARGLYRAVCVCGWQSRALRNGNAAKERGEAHLGRRGDGWTHSYELVSI